VVHARLGISWERPDAGRATSGRRCLQCLWACRSHLPAQGWRWPHSLSCPSLQSMRIEPSALGRVAGDAVVVEVLAGLVYLAAIAQGGRGRRGSRDSTSGGCGSRAGFASNLSSPPPPQPPPSPCESWEGCRGRSASFSSPPLAGEGRGYGFWSVTAPSSAPPTSATRRLRPSPDVRLPSPDLCSGPASLRITFVAPVFPCLQPPHLHASSTRPLVTLTADPPAHLEKSVTTTRSSPWFCRSP